MKPIQVLVLAGALAVTVLAAGCVADPRKADLPDDGSIVIDITTYEYDTYGNQVEVDLPFHVKLECFNQEGQPCVRKDEEGKVVGVYPYEENAIAPWAWGFRPEPGASGVVTVTVTFTNLPGRSAKCQILAQPSDRVLDDAEAYVMDYIDDVPPDVPAQAKAICIATISAPLN